MVEVKCRQQYQYLSYMQPIAVPFRSSLVKQKDDQLWDPVRQRWVSRTPEEWVRQLWLQLWIEMGVPKGRISVEKGLLVNGQARRTDVVIYDQEYQPWLLLECKAPGVQLNQQVFDQAARYNMTLRVPYLVISNGHYSFAACINQVQKTYHHLDRLPQIGQ